MIQVSLTKTDQENKTAEFEQKYLFTRSEQNLEKSTNSSMYKIIII